jgi:hypothetical protein
LKFFLVTGLSVMVIQSVIIYFLYTPLRHEAVDLGKHLAEHRHFLIAHQKQLGLNLAKAFAVAGGLVWNYILYTRLVYKHKSEEDAIEELLS